MTKTITIEGMMCTHCSGHVTKALEGIAGVEKADVSHETGNAIVTCAEPVDDATLKAVVESQGYKVAGIE